MRAPLIGLALLVACSGSGGGSASGGGPSTGGATPNAIGWKSWEAGNL